MKIASALERLRDAEKPAYHYIPMRPRPTFADYTVLAINPALIMFMVGSLVFFMIEVCFRVGLFNRLCWIMGLFVFAAVLISRISITEGREYAALFGIALAAATAIAAGRFVDLGSAGSLVTLGFVGFIWWTADKLTWDCTVIDDQEDQSGEGLLQTAGLDGEPAEDDAFAEGTRFEMEATTSAEPPPRLSWWERFVEYRRRPHAPGVWVLYFSLAALPAFGFGQWFAAQDRGSRRYVFQLLVVYIAAGLGLLVTTSFLGLRRYLRKRRLQMPIEMAGRWLGLGAAFIAAVLLFCMLLPRRNPEYSITDLPLFSRSQDLEPSEMGFGPDGVFTDDAERTVAGPESDPDGDPVSGGPAEEHQGKAAADPSSSAGEQRQTDQSGRDPGRRRPSRGERGADQQDQQGGEQQNNQGNTSESDGSPQNNNSRKASRAENEPNAKSAGSQSSADAESRANKARGIDPSRMLDQLGQGIGQLLKLLYWIAAIGVVCYLLWRYWSQVVQAVREFIQRLRDLWARLMGGKSAAAEAAARQPVESGPRHRPFADYPDPFLSGMAERYSAQQLIRYSFEALEAWAREHGCERQPEQTPHEFARAVARRQRSLSTEASRLAELYSWTAYGRDTLPAGSREHLRQFWQAASASAYQSG